MQKQGKGPLYVTRYRKKGYSRLVIFLPFVIIEDILLLTKPDTFIHPSIGTFVTLLAGIGFWLLFFTSVYPSYYEITLSALLVRSGLIRHVIPLISIQKVYPSHFVPHAKWPLNQLRIDYRLENQSSARPLFVVPEDETAFLHDLGERARNLGIVIAPF